MSGWVLDSSLALALGLPDESSGRAERFLDGLPAEEELWVPALWWYEVANAIVAAQRRKRLAEAEASRLMELYRGLPLETDGTWGPEAAWRFRNLAQEHGLSAYDAVYLELAERRGLGLASMDRRLVQSARRAGIKVM
ncbi:MAG: type II toxin-antitoxin system VapC family toxin [Elusimicrobia bacterium]|nr:type II toxin-antitoxin system VapC family toxin [Elusimicrobiota bacterium]